MHQQHSNMHYHVHPPSSTLHSSTNPELPWFLSKLIHYNCLEIHTYATATKVAALCRIHCLPYPAPANCLSGTILYPRNACPDHKPTDSKGNSFIIIFALQNRFSSIITHASICEQCVLASWIQQHQNLLFDSKLLDEFWKRTPAITETSLSHVKRVCQFA